MPKRENRVAVLGLDALPPDVLRYYAEDSGAMGYYRSIYSSSLVRKIDALPPLTPPSWSSIMTGVNPGKHGIFDFFKVSLEDGRPMLDLYTSLDLRHPRIHEMLSFNEGYTSIVLNPIPDTPLLPARGSIVAALSFFTPRARMLPRSLEEKYKGHLEEFQNILDEERSLGPKNCRMVDLALRLLGAYRAFLEDLLPGVHANLVWVNINIPDHVYHRCPVTLRRPSMLHKHFAEIDKIAKLLYEYAGNLILVSDHGMKLYNYAINVNEILRRKGLLKTSDRPAGAEEGSGKTPRVVRVPLPIYRLVKSNRTLALAAKTAAKAFLKFAGALLGSDQALVIDHGYPIDYAGSTAFMVAQSQLTPQYYVYVNGPREAADRVAAALSNVDKLEVLRTRDVFHGPYVDRAPPIMVLPSAEDEGYMVLGLKPNGIVYVPVKDMDNHARYGVIAAKLDILDSSGDVPEALPNHIVAPLVACALGAPLSSDTDSLGLVKRLCGGEPGELRPYRARWNMHLRILRATQASGERPVVV